MHTGNERRKHIKERKTEIGEDTKRAFALWQRKRKREREHKKIQKIV